MFGVFAFFPPYRGRSLKVQSSAMMMRTFGRGGSAAAVVAARMDIAAVKSRAKRALVLIKSKRRGAA